MFASCETSMICCGLQASGQEEADIEDIYAPLKVIIRWMTKGGASSSMHFSMKQLTAMMPWQ